MTQCYNEDYVELTNIMDDQDTDYVFSFIARVDYCYNMTLQGICDVGWTEEDAAVVCRSYYGQQYCEFT